MNSFLSHHSLLKGKIWLYYSIVFLLRHFSPLFYWRRLRRSSTKPPRKILLANWGTFGDLVLSTGVIAKLRSEIPGCKIGLLASQEAIQVCLTTPPVDWIHIAQTYLQPGQTRWQKIYHFFRFNFFEQHQIAKKIARIGYDCAIELRPFFPNLIPILWKARIPVRIGFDTSGNGELLSATAEWKGECYLPECYNELLSCIGIKKSDLLPRFVLQNLSPLPTKKPYLLFHLCSSNPTKELPIVFWKSLYTKAKEWGFSVYFSGKGERELRIIEQIAIESSENLCNKLSWEELVQCIQECAGLVSIDSVPIHIAAGLQIPTLALFVNTEFPLLWKPSVLSTQSIEVKEPFDSKEALQVIETWRASMG